MGELVGKDRLDRGECASPAATPDRRAEMLEDGRLSEGHARALLGVSDTAQMSRLARGRRRERLDRARYRKPSARGTSSSEPRGGRAVPRRLRPSIAGWKTRCGKRLGTDVRVTARRKGRGLIALSYYSNDDLARLLELLLGRPFEG